MPNQNKYKICIIDEAIPVAQKADLMNDTEIIDSLRLKILIEDDVEWGEQSLKDFVSELLKDNSWELSAFTNANIYGNYIDKDLLYFDVVMMDWEIGVGDPEDNLEMILNKTFSIVNVYTGTDKAGEIKEIVNNKFALYKNRIFVFEKGTDTPESILNQVESLYENNFSFKFSDELRKSTYDSTESVLIELGKLDFNQVLRILGDDKNTVESDLKELITERLKSRLEHDEELVNLLQEKDIVLSKVVNFLNMITDKLKNIIISKRLKLEEPKTSDVISSDLIKNLWSYRLYFKPSDDFVRRGDIILINEDSDKLYLVISAVCDLNHFWKKNMGYLSIVPLYKLNDSNKEYISKQLSINKKGYNKIKNDILRLHNKNENYFRIRSLTNNIENLTEGPIVIPFIRENENLHSYILFPKELTNKEIPIPQSLIFVPDDRSEIDGIKDHREKEKAERKYENDMNTKLNRLLGKLSQEPLTYSNSDGLSRITTISEPFITPLIAHIINNIEGYGVSDYPSDVSKIICNDLEEIFK